MEDNHKLLRRDDNATDRPPLYAVLASGGSSGIGGPGAGHFSASPEAAGTVLHGERYKPDQAWHEPAESGSDPGTAGRLLDRKHRPLSCEPPPVRQDNWISDECVIAIGYDAQDKVCHHGGAIGRPKEPSILDNILFQLRRMTGL